jgi:hypothetical protein
MGLWLGEVGFLALVKVAGVLDGVLAGYSWVFSLSVPRWTQKTPPVNGIQGNW